MNKIRIRKTSVVTSYQGMIVNFLYTVFRIITGIKYASVWFISIAVYYCLLGILRAYLIVHDRRSASIKTDRAIYEYCCYQTIGKLLFVLNIPMNGMVILMVTANSGFRYPGLVIYLSALYTFYMMILSVVNLVKSRTQNRPILCAAKILNFISAAMSVLGLQTAMIAEFGKGSNSFRRTMNALTGTVICVLVCGIACYMILNAHFKIKKAVGS